MKMESSSKGGGVNPLMMNNNAATNGMARLENGGGVAARDKENVFTGIYESAHFANLFVEFENDTRERAIDVPDHFVATTKTPPKFPPPFGGGGSGTLRSQAAPLYYGGGGGSEDGGGPQSRSSSLSMSNGHASFGRPSIGSSSPGGASGAAAPSTMPRSHLKIEEDGRLMVNNGHNAPPVPSRGSNRSNRLFGSATPEEQRRIKKYEAEIAKRAAEESRRNQQNEFLRHSIRNSQKIRALKEREAAAAAAAGNSLVYQQQQGAFNAGFSPDSSLNSESGVSSLSSHTAADLMALVERISSSQDILSVHPQMPESLARIQALFGDARFQKSLLFAQKVRQHT